MKDEGWWLNYSTGRIIPVTEHERAIRSVGAAIAMKIPSRLFCHFEKFVPVQDREKFLRWLMARVPMCRIRRHGIVATCEYYAKTDSAAYRAIGEACSRLGLVALNVVNLRTGKSIQVTASDLVKRLRRAGVKARISGQGERPATVLCRKDRRHSCPASTMFSKRVSKRQSKSFGKAGCSGQRKSVQENER